MTTNRIKAGLFSDGGHRIRIVATGYNADPAPTNQSAIIFDSDWPDVLSTAPGYYGSTTLSSSGQTNVWYSSLPFSPLGCYATPVPLQPDAYIYAPPYDIMSSALWSTLANAYLLSQPTVVSASSMTLPALQSVGLGLWAVFLSDPTALAGSRAGTTWMQWSSNGPVVAKPGRNVSSTTLTDFLIPPASMGCILGQPYLANTISSLPWYANWTEYLSANETMGLADYVTVVSHNLGYIPLVVYATYSDFRTTSSLTVAKVAVDTANLYIYGQGNPGSSGSMLSIAPVSYFILRNRWY
jgi:hypothetical protein